MIKGVTSNEEKIIKDILSKYPYNFFYYGSRVKGDFTKSSDLDILLMSDKNIPEKILNELKLDFNKSLVPYIVNISVSNNLDKSFYELIKPSLVSVF